MNRFKIGDRVRAVKDCNSNYFKKGEIGTVVEIYDKSIILDLGYYRQHVAYFDEIELIEPEVTRTPNVYASASQVFARANGLPRPGKGTHIITGTELIDDPKPFPTYAEFDKWFVHEWDGDSDTIYNYFAQFGVREVFPEVGKEYEFSTDGMIWEKTELGGFREAGANWTFRHIRTIQPSRLEELKAKRPNLTDDEKSELLDILLTKRKE